MSLPDYSGLRRYPSTWDPSEAKWVRLKWEQIRKSQQIADQSNRDWNDLNAAINRWMDEMGIIDIVQREKTKSESLPLKGALDTGKWHSANAQRHIDDVMLFLKLKETGIL